MTSVRLLADEFASIIGARETVLIDENDNLRQSLKWQRAETDFWKRENDDTEGTIIDIEATQLATIRDIEATQLATIRDYQEKLAAAKSLADWQISKRLAAAEEAHVRNSANAARATAAATTNHELEADAAAREATIRRLEADAAAREATNHELEERIRELEATIRERDRLELEALEARGDLEAEAERFRRLPRDQDADLRELGLAARENNEDMVEYF